MNLSYSRQAFLGFILVLGGTSVQAAESVAGKSSVAHGQFLGAMETTYPSWFKESFLELGDDAAEAADGGKRVMIVFHQDGCPYCNVLVERNLSQKDIESYTRENFDVVAINMWGDREVLAANGKTFNEKSFAAALKVQFTPTLIFLDQDGKTVLRLNGYLPPEKFLPALKYVAEKRESKESFNDYLARLEPRGSSGALNKQDFFNDSLNLKAGLGSVQAVFFEQKQCPNCDVLHQKVLQDETTRNMVVKARSIQLDMWSDQTVVTPEGDRKSAREWARDLDIKYAPTVVLFDKNGKEVIRSEAFFKTFHTEGIFDYALHEAYKSEPSFQRWLNAKAEHLRELGQDVDIWK